MLLFIVSRDDDDDDNYPSWRSRNYFWFSQTEEMQWYYFYMLEDYMHFCVGAVRINIMFYASTYFYVYGNIQWYTSSIKASFFFSLLLPYTVLLCIRTSSRARVNIHFPKGAHMRKIRKIREIEIKKKYWKNARKKIWKKKTEENFKVLCVSVFMYFVENNFLFFFLYFIFRWWTYIIVCYHTHIRLHIYIVNILFFCSFADMDFKFLIQFYLFIWVPSPFYVKQIDLL